MSRAQFAGIHPQPAPTVVAASGGSLTGSGTLYVAIQGRNRAGYSLVSSLVSVNYVAGQKIDVTIPSTARGVADDIHEWHVLGSLTNSAGSLVSLAVVKGYQGDDVTPTTLPVTVSLTRNAHIGLSVVVANSAALPTGSDLIRGMVRFVTAYSRYYRYDPDSTLPDNSGTTATVLAATVGRWIATGSFTTYRTDQTGAGGCDQDVRDLDPSTVLVPAYAVDGSLGTPIKLWWLHAEGTAPLPTGTRMGVAVYIDGVNKSLLFDSKLKFIFDGYADPTTGTLDTTGMDVGGIITYQARKTDLILQKDLPSGQAFAIRLYPQFSSAELLGQITANSYVQVFLFPYKQSGEYNEAGYLFGDFVYPTGNQLLVVPDAVGAKMLSGGALVRRFSFADNPEVAITGLAANVSDQQVTIDGNGGVFVRIGTLPSSERLRALVSTANCVSAASPWSSTVAVGGSAGVRVTVTYPSNGTVAGVRGDYPDALLAGLSGKAKLNAPTVRVYIENVTTGTIKRFDAALIDGATQQIDLTDWSAGTTIGAVPGATTPDACLFAPTSATIASNGSGNFTAGNYRVRYAFVYDSGTRVSAVSHDSLDGCLVTTRFDFAAIQNRLQYWGEAVDSPTTLRGLTTHIDRQYRPVRNQSYPYWFDAASLGGDDGTESSPFIRPVNIPAFSPGRYRPLVTGGGGGAGAGLPVTGVPIGLLLSLTNP